jgi:hypothetical protein
MNNSFIAEVISTKSNAESERLTGIQQAELTQTRSANLTAEIEKIVQKRKLKGDWLVFKSDEDFAKSGMDILRKYHATDSEQKWFLGLV